MGLVAVALMVEVVGGEMSWSGGLLVRHSFSADGGGSGAGVGLNLIAVAALTFLVMSQRRKKPTGRQSSGLC